MTHWAIEYRKVFRELAISSLNAQMKKRTRMTSVALTQLDCGPVQSFLGRGLHLNVIYDKNV